MFSGIFGVFTIYFLSCECGKNLYGTLVVNCVRFTPWGVNVLLFLLAWSAI